MRGFRFKPWSGSENDMSEDARRFGVFILMFEGLTPDGQLVPVRALLGDDDDKHRRFRRAKRAFFEKVPKETTTRGGWRRKLPVEGLEITMPDDDATTMIEAFTRYKGFLGGEQFEVAQDTVDDWWKSEACPKWTEKEFEDYIARKAKKEVVLDAGQREADGRAAEAVRPAEG